MKFDDMNDYGQINIIWLSISVFFFSMNFDENNIIGIIAWMCNIGLNVFFIVMINRKYRENKSAIQNSKSVNEENK